MSERLCPSCGTPCGPQAVFCGSCGLNLASATAAMGAPDGESQPLPPEPPRPEANAPEPYQPIPAVGPVPSASSSSAPANSRLERQLLLAAYVLAGLVLIVFATIFIRLRNRTAAPDEDGPASIASPEAGQTRISPDVLDSSEAAGVQDERIETEIATLDQQIAEVEPAEDSDLQEYASRYGLLSAGGQVQLERATIYTAGFNDLPRLKTLLSRHPDLSFYDESNQTALGNAAANGSREALLLLLESGANVDQPALASSSTPLHQAASGGDVLSLGILLSYGANPEAFDGDGMTPLIQAAVFGNSQAASMLLANGARVDTRSADGRTALMAAAAANQPELLRLLLEAGADAGLSDQEGWTALHFAAMAGSPECINILDSAGADSGALDNNGNSPADIARQYGQNNAPDNF